MGSREVLVGTRERDFDSLLPGDSINDTSLDNNSNLKNQPCFVCSFRWVLNGGPAGGESSSTNEKEIDSKKIDRIEEKGGVVKSRVGTVDGQQPGSGDDVGEGDEGGEKNSTIVGGEEVGEVNVSNNAGLKVGNGKIVTISHV